MSRLRNASELMKKASKALNSQKPQFPDFKIGDVIRVHVKVKEGEKTRVQVYEGLVIRQRRGGDSSSFTVRKISYSIGVERIFPYSSPVIEKIQIISRGEVRRAKLYYLRKLSGRASRIKSDLVYGEEGLGASGSPGEGSTPPEAKAAAAQG